ncbi:cytochrome P450 [Irpex rosettiformis]|uniref:Cytochrome P450 n=1 Tax=Irpex rosettiformis TaxID=378272 RepID=A0ACB8TWD5_9APHY|nr:cytochrome P450 [Irpex rosettiformis]
MSSTPIVLYVCFAFPAVFLLARVLGRRHTAPYPPGPKGLPFIGNMFDMPSAYPWHTFTEWGRTFGDMVYINTLGKRVIILNSARQATAMLDKRSSIYSDRPVSPMGGELVGLKDTLIMAPYGPQSREHRRYIRQSIGSKTPMERHHAVIIGENREFLKRLLGSHQGVAAEIRNLRRRTAGAVLLKITYGYTTQQKDDPVVALAENIADLLASVLTPGAWLIDTLPFLRYLPAWFPGARFKKVAADMRQTLYNIADVPYRITKHKLTNSVDLPPNLIAECLEKEDLNTETESNIKWAAAAIYSGGVDTTVSAMHSFVLAMTLYPNVQKHAQAEIDTVIGDERLPSFKDRAHLPFIEAIVKEILRWRCPGPLNVPHRATEDAIHDGYYIPKGTTIIANIWAILHNPEVYPNPDTFDPSRFVSETGEPTDVPSPYDACFGYGRRICPGINFADASIFIWCAMILAVYDISKAVGEDGKVVEPTGEYTSGAVSHPKPFECSIVPRSEKARGLILSMDE